MKPIAQTFTIDPVRYKKGLFLTSVELFFAKKPTGTTAAPVFVTLHSVENRVPQPISMPGSEVFLSADSVSTPAVGDSASLSGIQSAPTKFTFDEPIFLSPGYQYAIATHSRSSDYRLYGARSYDFVIGTTGRRVNKAAGLDDLFTTTSAAIWNPDTTLDLMIKLNKARFTKNTTYTAFLENADPGRVLLGSNPILTDSGGTTVTMLHPDHGFVRNDKVFISGLDSNTTYNGMKGTSIIGERTITGVDHTGYTFAADSNASSSLRTGGTGVIVDRQVMMNEYNFSVANLVPEDTSLTTAVKLTSGASFGTNRNSATNAAYATDATFATVITNEYLKSEIPELIATARNETTHNSGTKSVQFRVQMSTEDSDVSPIIDLQRSSIASLENIIDNQDSAGTALTFVQETDARNGTAASKHITKAINLAETAVGLKILLAANRPNEADFDMYFRTATADEVITDQPYTLAAKETSIAADEDPNIFREYSYLVGGIGGDLTPFTSFQLKIVFKTTNSSKVARIKDLRAIAMVT